MSRSDSFPSSVRREWRLLRADRTLWLLGSLFAGLALYAIINGYVWRDTQQRTVLSVQAEESGRLDSLDGVMVRLARGDTSGVSPFADPRSPAIAGRAIATRWLVLPPAPLAVMAVGQSDLTPYYVRVTSASRQTAVVNDEIENPVSLMAGRLDLALVILLLLPLFVLALTYDVVSGERERGVLALIAAQPVSSRRIVLMKFVVRALAVIAVAVVMSFIGAAASGALTTTAGVMRLGWWLGVTLAYAAFWLAVAVAVNVRGHSSAANAVTVLGAWFAFTIVVPALVANLLSVAYPVPPRLLLVNAVRAAQNEMSAAAAAEPGARADALADFLAEHPRYRTSAKADTSDPQVAGITAAHKLETTVQPVYEAFEMRLRARQDAAEWFRFLSPTLAAHAALLEAAGTGTSRARRFEDAWVDAHRAWRDFFNDRVFAGVTLTREELAKAPAPVWREAALSSLVPPLSLSLLALLVPTALVGWWGVRGLRNVRPTP